MLLLVSNIITPLPLPLPLSPPPPPSPPDYKMLDTRPRSHNLPSQSYDQLEELTVEMLEQLQSEQFLLDQYCSTILTNTAPLLLGYLNRHLTWTTTDGGEVPVGRGQVHSVAAHLAVAMELLSAVVELKETQGMVTNDRDTLTQASQLGHTITFTCMYMYM